jgi:hypothetical protein
MDLNGLPHEQLLPEPVDHRLKRMNHIETVFP